MDARKSIVEKFMKNSETNASDINTQHDRELQSLETDNIPDEFTQKLVSDTVQTFPSIHNIQQEEQKVYSYLDDDELSRDFLLNRDLTKQYSLQLVLYHMNNTLDTPFLEFYLENSNEHYGFPERLLDNEQLNETIEQHEKTQQGGMDIQTVEHGDIEIGTKTTIYEPEFISPFEQQVFALYNDKTGYSDIIAEGAYKGFVERDEIIYVLFENKDKMTTTQDVDYIWSIVDEMIMKKQVLGMPIHEMTISMFEDHANLAYIKADNTPVDMPLIGYPIDKINDIYENIYYSREDSQPEQPEQPEQTYLITLPNENDDLGHVFLFSNSVLPSNHEIQSIKRVVFFSQDALYTLTKPTKELFEKHPMVRFKDQDLTIWGISNYLLFTELL